MTDKSEQSKFASCGGQHDMETTGIGRRTTYDGRRPTLWVVRWLHCRRCGYDYETAQAVSDFDRAIVGTVPNNG